MIKTISIALRPHTTSEISTLLINLCNWLKKRSIAVYILEKNLGSVKKIFSTLPKELFFVDEKKFYSSSDLIITLGGDGTFIGAARSTTKNSPPILGINAGKLGFITEFSKGEVFDALDDIVKGNYHIEKINLFKVEVNSSKSLKKQESFFLNDAVVNKLDISRMLSLSVEINREHIYHLSGDGLIVSSPIGSTAYSLAGGGPIINPQVKAIVLTPICPHSLTHRPLVVSDKSEVVVKTPRTLGPLTLTLDGQEAVNLGPKSSVTIKRAANRHIKIIKNPTRTYFQTLRVKFRHGRKE